MGYEVHSLRPAPCVNIPQNTCYTDPVPKSQQNLTLVIDEDVLLAARKLALEHRTSVNQLIREYLEQLVQEPAHRRLAVARLKKAFQSGLVDVGERIWSRAELYER